MKYKIKIHKESDEITKAILTNNKGKFIVEAVAGNENDAIAILVKGNFDHFNITGISRTKTPQEVLH